MLIAISEALETPVSTLFGEPVMESEADHLKTISEKLEVINWQLAQRKATRRTILHWLLIALCVVIAAIFVVLVVFNSPIWGGTIVTPKPLLSGLAFTHWSGCLSD